MGTIHYAKLSSSKRLQRLLRLLSTGGEYTTLEITILTGVSAVSAAITELRRNGVGVKCRFIAKDDVNDSRTYGYQLEGV